MILSCPNCNARFKVNPAALGTDGRVVRCSKCAHEWHQAPEEAVEAGAPAAAAAPEPRRPTEPAPDPRALDDADSAIEGARRRAQARTLAADSRPALPGRGARKTKSKPKRGRAMAAVSWILLIVVVAAVAGGGFFFRDQVIAAWPPAVQFYQLVGLGPPLPGAGLKITSKVAENVDKEFTIEGTIKNETEAVIDVPTLKGVLLDKNKRELTRWDIATPERKLLPNEAISFSTTYRDPPPDAFSYRIDFASPTTK